MIFSREWAMPSGDTFSIPCIERFVRKYLQASTVSVDPFARNNTWSTYSNDINPKTAAKYHMTAVDFLRELAKEGVKCDLLLLDPPYSPRQVSECYKEAGLQAKQTDTQNSVLYKAVKEAALSLLTHDAVVLSFGWNSAGMGKKHGFSIREIMLVAHGGAHNDTICVAEQRLTADEEHSNG